jgi:hypothetical protein
MDALAQALCFCVVVGGWPYPQTPQTAGDITYRHELLARGIHLLRLSTTDLILDSNRFRAHRLYAFAEQFAAQTCQGQFIFTDTQRPSWPQTRPTYAKDFLFRCS